MPAASSLGFAPPFVPVLTHPPPFPPRPSLFDCSLRLPSPQPYVENELGAGTVQLLRDIKRQMDPQNILVRDTSPPLPAQARILTFLNGTLRTRASSSRTRRAKTSAWRTDRLFGVWATRGLGRGGWTRRRAI